VNSRIGLRAVPALTALIASAALTGFAPATASASASIVPFAKVPSSTNYAGWLAGVYGPRVASLTATTQFTVPAVTGCTSTDDFVVIGVGLPTGETSVTATGVAVGCMGGAPFYGGETDINGTITPVPVTINPGDKILLKLAVSGASTTGTFADKTQGFSQPIKGKGGKPTGSCVGIDGSENGTNGDPPVPDFGKVVFSSSEINGKTITASGATRVNMATASGVLQIGTGAVTKTGKGFTSTFKNSGGN
jgi:hypothetical protein